MITLAALLLSGAAGAFAQCSVSDPDALQWLARMSDSLRHTSYRGVFTYQQGNAVQAMRISHAVQTEAVGSDAASVELTADAVGATERMQHPLDCIHAGRPLVRLGDSYLSDAASGSCSIAASYDLRTVGPHSVAGRPAVVINVLPRDRFRYGYQLAIDRETGLLLKTQTVAEDGRVLERFQFADLSIGAVSEPGTQVQVIRETAGVGRVQRLAEAPSGSSEATSPRNDNASWAVGWLPGGFAPTSTISGFGYNKTYTDGIAKFSVFLERMSGSSAPGSGIARQGGTTAYTRGLTLSGQPVLITVLGEIPPGTAHQVAESITWTSAVSAR